MTTAIKSLENELVYVDANGVRIPAVVTVDGSGTAAGIATVDSHGSQQVVIYDASGVALDYTGSTPVIGGTAHDAAAASIAPVLGGGYASAAAPSDVSNDGDAVKAWFLRNGAQAIYLASFAHPDSEYETVAASQTAQVLGATGATGDFIAGVLVVPATTSPGNVLLLDNATSITVFTGGGTSVSNLVPFYIPLGMTSVSGAWKLTTGSNVSCIGIGNFT